MDSKHLEPGYRLLENIIRLQILLCRNYGATAESHGAGNHDEFLRIKQYINNNPKKWDDDTFNKNTLTD